MERVHLVAEKRSVGKSASKQIRSAGKIPAILYGKKLESLPVAVGLRDIETITKTKAGMNVLIDLSVEGGDSGLAVIRDYQADPFKRTFTHIDFQAISLDEKIDVEVPIELVGSAIGVKDGGVVEQLRRTIQLKALPTKIPNKIQVDISGLAIGNSIHADELKLPEGVEFPHVVNFSIVAVVPPAREEAPPVPEVAVGEEALAAEVAAEGEEGAAEGGEKKAAAKEEPKEKKAKE